MLVPFEIKNCQADNDWAHFYKNIRVQKLKFLQNSIFILSFYQSNFRIKSFSENQENFELLSQPQSSISKDFNFL